MKKILKKGFTLVELIVVITILAILGTIAFLSITGYSRDANNSKIIHDVASLNSVMQIQLSRGLDLDNLVISNRTDINGVDTGSTVFSGAYTLGNLKYEVGYFDFKKLRINGEDFKYNTQNGEREYLFSYVKTPSKLFYQFAGELTEESGINSIVIKGNYLPYLSTDTIGIISESGSYIGLKSGDYLTGSLY